MSTILPQLKADNLKGFSIRQDRFSKILAPIYEKIKKVLPKGPDYVMTNTNLIHEQIAMNNAFELVNNNYSNAGYIPLNIGQDYKSYSGPSNFNRNPQENKISKGFDSHPLFKKQSNSSSPMSPVFDDIDQPMYADTIPSPRSPITKNMFSDSDESSVIILKAPPPGKTKNKPVIPYEVSPPKFSPSNKIEFTNQRNPTKIGGNMTFSPTKVEVKSPPIFSPNNKIEFTNGKNPIKIGGNISYSPTKLDCTPTPYTRTVEKTNDEDIRKGYTLRRRPRKNYKEKSDSE